MRRVVFSLPEADLEDALDGILPRLIRGVRMLESGSVAADGTELSREELEALGGIAFTTWREETLDSIAGHSEPLVDVGGRLVIREPHQPAPQDGRLDVVVERRGSGFGSGDHPTTRLCLELLLELEPRAGLADLGCGIGTLAIVAAKLGWSDVVGVDRDGNAVETALENVARNRVHADLWTGDLLESEVPYRPTLLVNAPPEVHRRVAEGIGPEVSEVVASSFMADEIEPLVDVYGSRGLKLVRAIEDGGWAALLLTRDGEEREVEVQAQAPATTEDRRPKPPPLPVATLLDPDRIMDAGAAFGQLAARLPGGGVAVSAARLLERGARGAVIHVPGLFRFDLAPARESFGVTLRELAAAPMRWEADPGTVDGFRRDERDPMIFRGAITLPDARLSVGLQALSAADEDQGAVHVVATAGLRVV